MSAETLLVAAPSPNVRIVTLNRPASRNAIDTGLAGALASFFSTAPALVAADVRAIVVTGAGEHSFCAGADLKERLGLDVTTWTAQHELLESAFDAIGKCPIPLIAAVNGYAFGGGCELMLACDLAIASEAASFSQPEVLRGIIPGCGGTCRLASRIGTARAKEMIFTGRRVSTAEALQWGLVNRVVPASEVRTAALELAAALAANAPVALREAKSAIDRGWDLPLEEALARELQAYRATLETEDRHEGIAAFNEKRTPCFTNR